MPEGSQDPIMIPDYFGTGFLMKLETFPKDKISVRSSDQVVFEIDKSAAISECRVFGDLIDCIPNAGNGEDEIPVAISSLFLQNINSFCKKKHKFTKVIESTAQLLRQTVDDYKAWLTAFVKSNISLFPYLHQAADYLNIPALFELTSVDVGDMSQDSVAEISEWYGGLSIARMLSPLGILA